MIGIEYIVVALVLELFMIIDPIIDFRQIKSGKEIHYPSHNIILGALVVCTLLGAWVWGFSIREALAYAIVFPFVRWIHHDLLLNALRKLPVHYLGTRAKTDQVLRFFREEMGIPSMLIRAIALAGSISIALNILYV